VVPSVLRALRALAVAVAIASVSEHAAAQDAPPPMRFVFEGAFGASRHSVVGSGDPQLRLASSNMMAGHLSLGVILRPAVSLYLSEDGGADFVADGTNELYRYHTAFAELSAPQAPALALRVGGGMGRATAFANSLHGKGAVARIGIAARTPTTDSFALVFAVDAFTGLSGRYASGAPGLAQIHSAFHPTSVQATLGFRLQLPRA
jgi:hypothetical protein